MNIYHRAAQLIDGGGCNTVDYAIRWACDQFSVCSFYSEAAHAAVAKFDETFRGDFKDRQHLVIALLFMAEL